MNSDAGGSDTRTTGQLPPVERAVVQGNVQDLANHGTADPRSQFFTEKLPTVIAFLAFLAAAWQGYIASDTEKKSLRAYIVSDGARITTLGDRTNAGSLIYHVTGVVKNAGQTPAIDVVIKSGFAYLVSSTDNSLFSDKQMPNGVRQTKSTVAQGQAVQGMTFGFPSTWIAKIDKGAQIAIFGIVRYTDIFGNHHITEYCEFLQPPSLNLDVFDQAQHPEWHEPACPEHNCIDGNCPTR